MRLSRNRGIENAHLASVVAIGIACVAAIITRQDRQQATGNRKCTEFFKRKAQALSQKSNSSPIYLKMRQKLTKQCQEMRCNRLKKGKTKCSVHKLSFGQYLDTLHPQNLNQNMNLAP